MSGWRYKILKQERLDQLLKEHGKESLILEITHRSKAGYHLLLKIDGAKEKNILGRLSKKQFDQLKPEQMDEQPGYINISWWKITLLTPEEEDKILLEHIKNNIDVSYSRGYGKNGKRHWFVSPKRPALNREEIWGQQLRRVSGFETEELEKSVIKLVKKWYYPLMYFLITDKNQVYWVGSNSEENALKEYWRYCSKEDIGKEFPIRLLERQ